MKQMSAAEVAAKHNASLPPKNHNSSGQLKSYVERFTNLAEQMADLREDQKELAKEAKGNGFDVPALKAIVKKEMETKEQREKRAERESIIETYESALGIVD